MGLFSRRRHDAADPREEAAEMYETSGSSLVGPGALGFVAPADESIDAEVLRVTADPEDDTSEELLIDKERRTDEHGV